MKLFGLMMLFQAISWDTKTKGYEGSMEIELDTQDDSDDENVDD